MIHVENLTNKLYPEKVEGPLFTDFWTMEIVRDNTVRQRPVVDIITTLPYGRRFVFRHDNNNVYNESGDGRDAQNTAVVAHTPYTVGKKKEIIIKSRSVHADHWRKQ